MDTLGRKDYPEIVILGEQSIAKIFFLRALRFSTHGEFYIDKDSINFLPSLTPHYHLVSDLIEKKAKYRFDFFGKNFLINKQQTLAHTKNIYHAKLKCLSNDANFEFIMNADKSIEYICSETIDGRIEHNYISSNDILLPAELLSSLSPGDVISLEKSHIKGKYRVYINLFSERWDCYRSIGINIPLLVLQVLLGRNVSTLPLVDFKNLICQSTTISKRKNLSLPHILWFDLDETLICRWKPITEMLSFLKKCVLNGHDIRLLTRHTFNIEETLKKIDLTINHFSKIIVISKDQKKSEFVKRSHGFIDNEFAERFDVRTNIRAFVMDLDQIDYVAFDKEF